MRKPVANPKCHYCPGCLKRVYPEHDCGINFAQCTDHGNRYHRWIHNACIELAAKRMDVVVT